MPWVHRSREEIAVSPIRQYSISVYSRYREDGRPMFSVFFNVKRSMIKDIKNAWKHCVLDVSTSSPLRLLDHWALQSASLARLQEECRFQEALYEVIVCCPFSIPVLQDLLSASLVYEQHSQPFERVRYRILGNTCAYVLQVFKGFGAL